MEAILIVYLCSQLDYELCEDKKAVLVSPQPGTQQLLDKCLLNKFEKDRST